MTDAGLAIADAAQTLGLSPDTLRYYEKDGLLLRPVPRTNVGHRRYQDRDLAWIELLTCLRRTGMPVRDIRRYAELVRTGSGTEGERRALLGEHRLRVLERLAEVNGHLAAIDRKIEVYEDVLAGQRTDASSRRRTAREDSAAIA